MKTREKFEILARLQNLGFTWDEANQLRRISLTLNHWFELECGTGDDRVTRSIEREENGEGRPFMRIQYMGYDGKWIDERRPIADREAGARKRLAAIMASRKRRLLAYVQGDCRGASLYILRRRDVKPGEAVDSVYNRGVAVY